MQANRILVRVLSTRYIDISIVICLTNREVKVILELVLVHSSTVLVVHIASSKTTTTSTIKETFNIVVPLDLAELLVRVEFLVLITCVNPHESYISVLEQYNLVLSKTNLFIIFRKEFMMVYSNWLNFNCILETSNALSASKLIGPTTLNIKLIKTAINISYLPIK